jgi:hypothetical protein
MSNILLKCNGCKEEKPTHCFNVNRGKKRGFQYKCRDCCVAVNREWKKNNRERYNFLIRRWNSKHRDELRVKYREYSRKNREVWSTAYGRRRAAERGTFIGDRRVILEWIRSWKGKRFARCYWCGGKFASNKCHADHIVSISRGGAHSIENLCVSCKTCNQGKHASPLSVWNTRLVEPVLF